MTAIQDMQAQIDQLKNQIAMLSAAISNLTVAVNSRESDASSARRATDDS
ncbi:MULTISPECIES: hypothetical protein [Pseudomonas]|nr:MULTISPECIES: hypothetical protein [Pseudomonas]WIN05143.1 hypothetical protein QQF68_16145 [Pseudomonas syringae pv. antirrhini str. 126]